MEKQKQQPQRLQSLDALRGFDMLFIMGGASLFVALATLFPNLYCGYLVSVLTREATRKRYDGRGDL